MRAQPSCLAQSENSQQVMDEAVLLTELKKRWCLNSFLYLQSTYRLQSTFAGTIPSHRWPQPGDEDGAPIPQMWKLRGVTLPQKGQVCPRPQGS